MPVGVGALRPALCRPVGGAREPRGAPSGPWLVDPKTERTMTDLIQYSELQAEVRKLLRYRIPLLLGLLLNLVLIARFPVAALHGDGSAASYAATIDGPSSTRVPDAGGSSATVAGELPPEASGADVVERGQDPHQDPEVASQCVEASGSAELSTIGAEIAREECEAIRQQAKHVVCQLAGEAVEAVKGWWVDRRAAMPSAPSDAQPVAPTAACQESPQVEATVQQHNPTSLVLRNAADSHGRVRFLVQGHVRELLPGESCELPAAEQWLVEFHRGGDLDDVRRTLAPGRYQFELTPSGWELRAIVP